MKKLTIISAILFALCAVIWSARAVIDMIGVINLTSVHSTAWLIGDVLCAVCWIAAFVVQVIRITSKRSE